MSNNYIGEFKECESPSPWEKWSELVRYPWSSVKLHFFAQTLFMTITL